MATFLPVLVSSADTTTPYACAHVTRAPTRSATPSDASTRPSVQPSRKRERKRELKRCSVAGRSRSTRLNELRAELAAAVAVGAGGRFAKCAGTRSGTVWGEGGSADWNAGRARSMMPSMHPPPPPPSAQGFSAWTLSGTRFEVANNYRLIRAIGTGVRGDEMATSSRARPALAGTVYARHPRCARVASAVAARRGREEGKQRSTIGRGERRAVTACLWDRHNANGTVTCVETSSRPEQVPER